MSRITEYDTTLTQVFSVMPRHCEQFARETTMRHCVPEIDPEVRSVLYFPNGAEEHHITRDDSNRIVAIFTRNLKTGVANI